MKKGSKKNQVSDLVTYNLRVSEELRAGFNETCKKMDTSGSREIRKFMRDFMARNGQSKLI